MLDGFSCLGEVLFRKTIEKITIWQNHIYIYISKNMEKNEQIVKKENHQKTIKENTSEDVFEQETHKKC